MVNRLTVFPRRVGISRSFLFVLLRRLPFTAAMVAAVLVAAAITDSLAHPLSAAALHRWGFGLEQLRAGRLDHLLSAPFPVLRPYMAITIVAVVILFVGACEYRLGSRRAVIAFAAGHVAGYVGGAAALGLLARSGWEWAEVTARAVDVGASNGAFGAAGAAIVFLAGRARKVAFLLLAAFLLVALVGQHEAWDVGHVLAFPAGLAVGRIFLRAMGREWPGLLPRWQIEERQRPTIVSWAARLAGVANIMGCLLIPHHAGFARLESYLPVGGPHWPRHLLLVTGFVLLTLAPGLARGRRTAWWGALCALALSLIVQLHVGITWFEAALAGIFIAALIAWRRSFRAPAHPPSLRSGIALLASLPVTISLYGLVGFRVLHSRFEPSPTWGGALAETLTRAVFSPARSVVPSSRPADWFLGSIPLFAWLCILYALARIVRSVSAPAASPTDIDTARLLLRSSGNSGTSFMTLWKGNSLFFESGRQSYVAYRVVSGVAIALGDPIGPPGASAGAIDTFSRFASGNGWIPVCYAVSARFLDEYRGAGYETLQIGEEAVVQLPGLEFRGRHWQSVRSAGNRAQRSGVTFRMYEGGTVPPELREQLFEISAEWAAGHDLPMMDFTLGTTEDVDDPDVNVAVAVDEDGRVHAFADWLPVYARRGWVIDLMRRRPDAMNGVMDFVIGNSLMAFQGRGYETASLATAPLGDVDRGESNSLLEWLLGKVYGRSETFYDFRSLFRYKEKFHPAWESVYLAHRGIATLPAVAAALVRAYLPTLGAVDATKLLGASIAARLFPRDGRA